MEHRQSPSVRPAPRDVSLTLPPLPNQAPHTSVRRWLRREWIDGFVAGTPLALLATGDVVRSPCAGYLRWRVPVGKPVHVGDRLALIRRIPQPVVPSVQLGKDLETKKAIEASLKQLASGCYILGVQGMGKSSLLVEIVRQLLDLSEAVIVFDPAGKLIDDIVARMPQNRLADTYVLDLKDRAYPFSLNIFACVDPASEVERDRTRNQVMHAFEKLWPETKTQLYFNKLLRHIVMLLIEFPHLTLADVPELLRDSARRTRYTQELQNEGSRDFWRFDYDRLTDSQQKTETKPLLSRIDTLTAEPVLRRVLCQPQATLNIRELIAKRKNLFIRLPINEDAYRKSAEIVGTMLMAIIYATTFSFAELPEEQIPGFSLIVDEFQNFATDEYARLFAQGRKYKVKQFLAHQYREQLTEAGMEQNKAATLTAQTKVIFKVHPKDAKEVAGEFVSLQQQRQRVNLDIAPLALLHKHPHPAVKEFANLYGEALLAGAHDKIIPVRLTARERRDPQPAHWPSSSDPTRNFGGDSVSFSPRDAATAVDLLNDLLYTTEKTGRIDTLRVQTALRHMVPLLGARNLAAHRTFAGQLRDVLAVLAREPITVGRSRQTKKDVAEALENLSERQAYVRVGDQTGVLRTTDMPDPVPPAEAARRINLLQAQTRRDLCRKATKPREEPATQTTPGPPTTTHPEDSVSPKRPHSRRSRRLPEGE
jgi:type IV secretory system conjugative DNA transfer VirD4/TraG family protein